MSNTNGRLRILIADDHGMVREGLTHMLRGEGFQVIAEVGTGQEAVQVAAREQPDVVLMDVRMPDMDGLTALAAIKRQHPGVAVIMVSTYENASYMLRAIASGAAGYILKGVQREVLVEGVQRAARGESILDRHSLQRLLKGMVRGTANRDGPAGEMIEPLTERELEILALVAEGLTNKEIGDVLFITEGTARVHVHNILTKLGVGDRTQAAVWAVRSGIVS